MRYNKHLRLLGVALGALVVIFITMALTARGRTAITPLEKGIATVLYPFQVATDWVGDRARGIVDSIRELTRLREENAALRQQVADMAQDRALIVQLQQENERLRKELGLKERTPYPMLTAEVISRSAESWYQTVIISRGSRDGVRQGMAVVNWQGLVGKIAYTTPYTSTVQLVSDVGFSEAGFTEAGFGAGAKLPNGEQGVLETVEGGYLRMRFWSTDPSVAVGQPVFTSGQGILPADLLVGWIEEVDTSSSFVKSALVRPAVDVHKLEVVQVVLTPSEDDRGSSAP
ncbi:rod shape-determining protein MreC [Symbiobacterium thermophilum]|uniref:Cell shape-determining protein MreC n=1 Tax=Symbiobacterium thermophilum TaxID=2734 RepID=A0A953LF94_SYMTR|nr:rod shape-determining protein MreC [Symbiobacterium thermophilum]MBY6275018.1 rod shape-determining protein MreC [Symbiobacterium thermophilum]